MSGTTLAGLQSDLTSLKAGMKRIPLPTESYQHPSLPLSSKRLLNLYVEQEPSDARAAVALRSTQGLVPSAWTFGAGPVWAMNGDEPGALYVVSGTHLYRLSGLIFGVDPIIQDLGDVGVVAGADYPPNLMITIAVGVNAVVVCVPPNAFTCSHTDTAVNQIGGSFPGARSVAYLDGYFVFTSVNIDAQFFCSLLLDPTMFDALDFAFADGVTNVLRRVITLKGELWMCGDKGIEVWYDAGQVDFPFRRRTGAVIPFGVASIKSIAIADGSLFWVGANRTVMRSQGYQAIRVSTHAIEAAIENLGVSSVLRAMSYISNGHEFYVLSFPSRTFVYDVATKEWHDRASTADGSGAWLPNAVGNLNDVVVFGDSVNGQTYTLSPGISTDNGVTVLRSATFPPLWAGTHRAFCNRLEIEMEVGTGMDGDISLDWSDDGGQTFGGGPRSLTASPAGFRGRVVTTRLGSFRQRVFRVSAPHPMTIYAVDADITQLQAG